ncbi:MAG: L-threonylcarbamoyladenylate synthase [Anaerovoracaceae bacterium]
MDTKILSTTEQDIEKAAAIIKNGGLVAFPTETVYGLGADALNEEAVSKIYIAKGRPSDNPMIVHIACCGDMDMLTPNISEDAKILMKNFWPGPMTMIVNKKDIVPERTTGGLDTVAVRMPDSKTALALISKAGCPIAAPSANLSGSPSPTRAEDVIDDMQGRIDAVISGEDCQIGIESTVIDMTGNLPVILRPGILTAEEISKVLGKSVIYDKALSQKPQDSDFKPKSPGMKYKHYAPKAEMIIIESGTSCGSEPDKGNLRNKNIREKIEKIKREKEEEGLKVGVIIFDESERQVFRKAANQFFARLRDLDKEGVDVILAGALDEENQIGFAVMNRMLKSAGYNVIKEK